MAKHKPDDAAQQWIKAIATYDREFDKWNKRVDKILKRYKDEPQNARGYNRAKFNILWSNVQVAVPAVFSRLPKPDVSRRFRDNDPVGRVAALILERALEYELDHYPDYRAAMENCVQDRFLGGRGVAWVRYEPHISSSPDEPDDGLMITEDADESESDETEEAEETIEYECAPCDYVHWKDFGHTVARTWEEVTAVWRKVYMNRSALVERFGEEIGNKVPLDTKPDEMKKSLGDGDMYEAVIYEIWDKSSGKAFWLSKSLGQVIDEKDDPLELESFWPCPKPLYATITTDCLVPTPDFALYQDQANTLDVLTDRIEGLIKALQVKGAYDASTPELARIFTEGESGSMIPVNNWMAFAEKQGLKGSISMVDLLPIYQALEACYTAVEQQKAQIYEITGLADIIRGQSDPNETAAAQKMKGNFGSMRLRSMQKKVAEFASEILKIKAQIICKHFQPETIIKIGGAAELTPADQQLVPQAIQLLKDSDLTSFRIDVEADSMVQMDELQEKQDRMEFLKATGGFLKQAVEAGAQSPQMVPLLIAMLKFGVTGFKVGKTIEGEFDLAEEQFREQAKNPQPKPNPEMEKLQAQSQLEQMKAGIQDQQHMRQLQADQQAADMQSQREMEMERHKQEMQARQNQHQIEIEEQREMHRQQLEAQVEQRKAELDSMKEVQRIEFEKWKAQLEAETRILVAQISAAAKPVAEGESKPESVDTSSVLATAMQGFQAAIERMNAPKTIVRGPDGRGNGVM